MLQIEKELVAKKSPDVELIYVIADVNDQVTLGRVFGEQLPDLVFHAAAYKHVPLMEHNVQIAIRNNVLGTKSVGAFDGPLHPDQPLHCTLSQAFAQRVSNHQRSDQGRASDGSAQDRSKM